MKRTRIRPGTRVPVRINERDRTLLLDHTLADPEYAMMFVTVRGQENLVGALDLDELDDLIGFVAAEANHTKNRKVQMELDDLCERLVEQWRSYDDGNWGDSD